MGINIPLTFVARITGSTYNSASKTYDYDYEQIHFNPNNGQVSTGNFTSGNSGAVKATALSEIGRNMGGVGSPDVATNTFVLMCYIGHRVYICAGGGLLDVRYSAQDDKFFKTRANGEEEEWALSTQYPPAN